MYFLGAFIATYVDIFSLHIAQGYSINPQNQFCIFAELFAIYEYRRIQRQSEIHLFLCHSSNTRYIFHLPIDARHDCVITFDHVALKFSLWRQPQIPCSSLTEERIARIFFDGKKERILERFPRERGLTVTLQYRRRNLRLTRAFLLQSAR